MRICLSVGITLVCFVIFSCKQKNGGVQESAVPADTMTTTQDAGRNRPNDDLFRLSYAERKGQRLYEHYCAVCHGIEGKGDGFNAYNLDPKPKDMTEKGYLDSVTNDWLVQAVSLGGRGVKRSVLMPAYENTLSEEEIADLIVYLRYLSEND